MRAGPAVPYVTAPVRAAPSACRQHCENKPREALEAALFTSVQRGATEVCGCLTGAVRAEPRGICAVTSLSSWLTCSSSSRSALGPLPPADAVSEPQLMRVCHQMCMQRGGVSRASASAKQARCSQRPENSLQAAQRSRFISPRLCLKARQHSRRLHRSLYLMASMLCLEMCR